MPLLLQPLVFDPCVSIIFFLLHSFWERQRRWDGSDGRGGRRVGAVDGCGCARADRVWAHRGWVDVADHGWAKQSLRMPTARWGKLGRAKLDRWLGSWGVSPAGFFLGRRDKGGGVSFRRRLGPWGFRPEHGFGVLNWVNWKWWTEGCFGLLKGCGMVITKLVIGWCEGDAWRLANEQSRIGCGLVILFCRYGGYGFVMGRLWKQHG
jgi:hypothetical protein